MPDYKFLIGILKFGLYLVNCVYVLKFIILKSYMISIKYFKKSKLTCLKFSPSSVYYKLVMSSSILKNNSFYFNYY